MKVKGLNTRHIYGEASTLQEAYRILLSASGEERIAIIDEWQNPLMIKTTEFSWVHKQYTGHFIITIEGKDALLAWGIDLNSLEKYSKKGLYHVIIESNERISCSKYSSFVDAIKTAMSWSNSSVRLDGITLLSFRNGIPVITQEAFDFWNIKS